MNTAVEAQAGEVVSLLPRLMRQLFTIDDSDPATRLPLAQVRVCTLLSDGPLTMSALSRALGVSLSAMTQIADRLEAAGLVERATMPGDRRVRLLQLTPQALEMVGRRNERRLRQVLAAIGKLSDAERASVVAALRLLVAASAAEGPDTEQGDEAMEASPTCGEG